MDGLFIFMYVTARVSESAHFFNTQDVAMLLELLDKFSRYDKNSLKIYYDAWLFKS